MEQNYAPPIHTPVVAEASAPELAVPGRSTSAEHAARSARPGGPPIQARLGSGVPGRSASAADAGPGGGGGSGSVLPDDVRAKMEAAFSVDFSRVRVHEGARAADMGALAYAQGNDLHFAPGQYQPHTQVGQELIGHELTHVVQQSQGRVAAPGQAKGGIVDDPGLEHEADVLGARAARGEPVRLGAGARLTTGGGQVAQAKYKAKKAEKQELEKKLKDWGSEYMESGGKLTELVNQLIDYCDSHDQALLLISHATYDAWSNAVDAKKTASDFENELLGHATGAKDKDKDESKDETGEAKKKIKNKGLDPSLFTQTDLQSVVDLKDSGSSWEEAITQVYSVLMQAKQDAEAKQKLVQAYAADKAIGDAAFSAGLVSVVWKAAYSVATSPGTNGNATAAGEYDDADILAAVSTWESTGGFAKISKLHVPKTNGDPIEDKSKRAKNPDKSRGRQADFISSWGAVTVNIHVNSTTHH